MGLSILNTGPTTGEKFGQALATGLSSLAEGKLAQIKQRNQRSSFEDILKTINPNLKPEEATKLSGAISRMSPEDRAQFSKGLSQQWVEKSFQDNLSNEFGMGEQTDSSQGVDQLRQAKQQQVLPERDEFTPPPPPAMKPIDEGFQKAKTSVNTQENVSKKDNLVSVAKDLIKSGYPMPKNGKEKTELFKAAQKQMIEDRKLAHKERQLDREDQRDIDKETLPVYQEVLKQGKVAAHEKKVLNRVKELMKHGDFGGAKFNALMDTVSHGVFGFGIDLNSLKTADAQELDKLSVEFLPKAKDIFGARVTDLDLKTYLKGIPTSSQSLEGMDRVVNNMEIFNIAGELRPKAMMEIIAENGGKRPRDLELLIEERISPELDRLSAEFRENAKAMALEAEKKQGEKDSRQGKKYWELL